MINNKNNKIDYFAYFQVLLIQSPIKYHQQLECTQSKIQILFI